MHYEAKNISFFFNQKSFLGSQTTLALRRVSFVGKFKIENVKLVKKKLYIALIKAYDLIG